MEMNACSTFLRFGMFDVPLFLTRVGPAGDSVCGLFELDRTRSRSDTDRPRERPPPPHFALRAPGGVCALLCLPPGVWERQEGTELDRVWTVICAIENGREMTK